MLHKHILSKLFAAVFFLVLGFGLNAEPSIDEGKALFKANCANCHAKNMKSKLTGPALAGLEDRWADYPREDLYSWVRNSQKLIASGHPRANELWNEWGSIMNNFPNLTDEQIEGIILYVNGVADGSIGGAPTVANTGGAGSTEATSSGMGTTFYIMLLAVLGILAFILMRIVSNLNRMADIRDGGEGKAGKSILESLLSPRVIGFVLFVLVVLGGYTTANNAISLGRQQGYQPEQPIKFSHVTHAGINKIDCQYCHDGARRSKHSVIPATNTCMNCHAAITAGSKYGTAELTKIFASAGFNPNTGKYFENFDSMEKEAIEKEFAAWVEAQYREKNPEAKDKVVEEEVKLQLANIMPHAQKEIEWIRIHNLPDHAYFNHAQHVSVGQVECQTCHGPVEEMEVVQQYSPLSMGWCINCHRETEVKAFKDNPYYESYERYHKELKEGDRTGVTVEEIGGLECQKCHY